MADLRRVIGAHRGAKARQRHLIRTDIGTVAGLHGEDLLGAPARGGETKQRDADAGMGECRSVSRKRQTGSVLPDLRQAAFDQRGAAEKPVSNLGEGTDDHVDAESADKERGERAIVMPGGEDKHHR